MTNAVNIAQSGSNNQTMRNRIINGAMTFDQRNNGASLTISNSVNTYTLDRWSTFETTDGEYTVQQVTDAPAGFTNSVKITTTTADASLASGQRVQFQQPVEGYNVADLGWGTATAQSVTLSFWVKSSLTGTFAGAFTNEDVTRSYVFNYTINAANTWEYKTVTVPGDTTGTWLKTNGLGIRVYYALGTGTEFQNTANTWLSAFSMSTSGAVSVIGTLNATWQLTGVQLEKGTAASPFENRLIGTELQLCQRYFQVIQNTGAGTGSAAQDGGFIQLAAFDTVSAYGGIVFQQTMRASPSISLSDTAGNTINLFWNGTAGDCDSFQVNNTSTGRAELAFSATNNYTPGNAVWARIKTNKSVLISAEL